MRRPTLAGSALLNLVGEGLPLVVGLVCIPSLIAALGAARFGVLALAWIVLAYFGAFDLGIGRATTKFVAEALGGGTAGDIPSITWTAVKPMDRAVSARAYWRLRLSVCSTTCPSVDCRT